MFESKMTLGARVERVRGTSIEGLRGTIRLIQVSERTGEWNALVALDDPEPGIGHQFVAPMTDLAPLRECVFCGSEDHDGGQCESDAAHEYDHDEDDYYGEED